MAATEEGAIASMEEVGNEEVRELEGEDVAEEEELAG